MEKIKVIIPSHIHHNAQIITGFLMLKEQGWNVELEDRTGKPGNAFEDLPVVLAEYKGKKLVYDLWDGYQDRAAMEKCLDWADVYLKRSYSEEKNTALFPQQQDKILPLGFNYHLTHKKNPVNEPVWKALAKPLMGRAPDVYFTAEVFEGRAEQISHPPRILFLTRLWDDKDPSLDEATNRERTGINEARIHIIRTLRERYGDAFVGGLNDNALSRAWAADLVVPARLTERKKYVKLLHSCDICIGTMGLHESIGWKTAEYVAAAKAIVNETFHYQVPGAFTAGKNYLAFETAQQCIDAVQSLVDDPEKLYRMKLANETYYRNFLKPDLLVKNSLTAAEKLF